MSRFRLERVLDYRRMREEFLEREFREAQQMLWEEETILEALQKDSHENQEMLYASQGTKLLGGELKIVHLYHETLKQMIDTQKSIITRKVEILTEKWQDLLEARQKKKAIEKVREKGEKQYVQVLFKHEQQLLDEIGIRRFRHEE